MSQANTKSRSGPEISGNNDFTDVLCVLVDGPVQQSKFSSDLYLFCWVDGRKDEQGFKRYLYLNDNLRAYASTLNGRTLAAGRDWDIHGNKAWLKNDQQPTPESFTVVTPATDQFIQDDLDRTYEQEVDDTLEMSEERKMAQVITQLGVEFPHLDPETRKSIAITVYIQRNKR